MICLILRIFIVALFFVSLFDLNFGEIKEINFLFWLKGMLAHWKAILLLILFEIFFLTDYSFIVFFHLMGLIFMSWFCFEMTLTFYQIIKAVSFCGESALFYDIIQVFCYYSRFCLRLVHQFYFFWEKNRKLRKDLRIKYILTYY